MASLIRHIPFLKAVALYAVTAFGGPQGHIGMMIKTFVNKRHDVTEEELIEYNSFCQMLPGPSSTQTVMLIGWKRGGIPLALITVLIWLLPATIIMSVLSFMVYYLADNKLPTGFFRFVHAMSVGFALYAAVKMMRKSVSNPMTYGIMIVAIIATVFIKSPWLFPILLILGGIFTNFSKKRILPSKEQAKPIKSINLWLFALIFILIGVFSEIARINAWEHRRLFNISENFYRFGAIVFGGGQALLPMMLVQFVTLPISRGSSPFLSSGDIMTGYGLVQAVPGPVFSISAFIGGIMMADQGPLWQAVGCAVAALSVFLPSSLLLLFFFPVYQNLKRQVVIYRALEGVNATIVGIVWASAILLFQEINKVAFDWWGLVVVILTFLTLQFTKLPAPFIVIICLILGFIF